MAVALPCLMFTACGDDEVGEEPETPSNKPTDDSNPTEGKDDTGEKDEPTGSTEGGDSFDKGEAVDLGLSVQWATCNVGAEAPEEFGEYFTWGGTAPQQTYSWSDYIYCNGTYNSITKYNDADKLTMLQPADDAATANFGKKWRTPTKKEYDELCAKCDWTWEEENGTNGYRVTGSTGNSIFLPAAGFKENDWLPVLNREGYYWLADIADGSNAKCAFFDKDRKSFSYRYRCNGFSIRPVRN